MNISTFSLEAFKPCASSTMQLIGHPMIYSLSKPNCNFSCIVNAYCSHYKLCFEWHLKQIPVYHAHLTKFLIVIYYWPISSGDHQIYKHLNVIINTVKPECSTGSVPYINFPLQSQSHAFLSVTKMWPVDDLLLWTSYTAVSTGRSCWIIN